MTKPYNNNAVIGNGSLLACLQKSGEICRLYWPHLDYPQHIDKFTMGICEPDKEKSTIWFSEHDWDIKQEYLTDTNILKTELYSRSMEYRIIQIDFAVPDRDIMIRKISLEDFSSKDRKTGFVLHSSGIQTSRNYLSTMFDYDIDGMIHYRHGYYLGISFDREITGFQIGHNSYEMAGEGIFGGFEDIGMMPDGAVYLDLGTLKEKKKAEITTYIAFSDSLNGVKEEIHSIKKCSIGEKLDMTKKYWRDFIKGAVIPKIKDDKIRSVFRRSVLIFGLMSDKKSGGLLASPEIDEDFTKCGRYGYCWGRDAAFITEAMDAAGLVNEVDKFYDWAKKTQNENGSWHQRYYMDGNLAPSWGIQADETGTLIYGMLKHYECIGDRSFLETMWTSVKKACIFLKNFRDNETGLPLPSHDIWEERLGEHAYSSAAVFGGFMAASKIADILGYIEEKHEYEKEADRIKNAILKVLWSEDKKHFLRSVRVKMNPWGEDPSDDKVYLKVNKKGYYRDFSKEDTVVDISLLGLVIPFNVLPYDDEKAMKTADKIKAVLSDRNTGGIFRYENDSYAGGNPWILTTLWLGMYYIEANASMEAVKYLEWAAKSATALDLLPEQVDKKTGKPYWVIPLTWSHAMFVLTVNMLFEKGIEI